MPLGAEDQARSDLYALASRLLLAPPDGALLLALGESDPIQSQGGDLALEQAWERLTLASSVMDTQAVSDEYAALFVSVGTPLINPYGSRYLSGFINDAPLAALRADLFRLGLSRMRGAGEFEDHLGALCEVMRVLIGRDPIAVQQQFFESHLAPWYARAVDDIAGADGANYYRLVARFVGALLALEQEAFAVGEEIDAAA